MKMRLHLKGGAGSGHRGHAGRPGLVGGSAAGAYSALSTKVDWNPYGVSTVMRGGNVPDKGPSFFTTDPDIAVGYGSKRSIGLYRVDVSNLLVIGSSAFYDIFDNQEEAEDLEYMAQELYSDPPEHFMRTLRDLGYHGYASSSGTYIRVEDYGKESIKPVKIIVSKQV